MSKEQATKEKTKAVVLISGGMDSAVCAAIAKKNFDEVIGLNMFYGQRHQVEQDCAKELAEYLKLDQLITVDLSDTFSHYQSALITAAGIEVKDDQDKNSVGATYVPARNSIFLSIAAGFADSLGATHVYYGAHADDHTGYPDCRPEYYSAMTQALKLGTCNGIEILAPFVFSPKSDIVKKGMELKVPFELTHSCYRGDRPACGTCPTCQLRLQAFKEAGVEDPLEYVTREIKA